MKQKRGLEKSPVKVITDPKKLAWLLAEIRKRKAHNAAEAELKRVTVKNPQS